MECNRYSQLPLNDSAYCPKPLLPEMKSETSIEFWLITNFRIFRKLDSQVIIFSAHWHGILFKSCKTPPSNLKVMFFISSLAPDEPISSKRLIPLQSKLMVSVCACEVRAPNNIRKKVARYFLNKECKIKTCYIQKY